MAVLELGLTNDVGSTELGDSVSRAEVVGSTCSVRVGRGNSILDVKLPNRGEV